MSERDNDFINRLLLTFKVEAREHVNAMVSNLLELEKASTPEKQKEVIEVLFREAHSLKGAARAVNLDEIERPCQEMEGVFAALKRKELTPSSELLDVLHQVGDSLGVLLRSTQVEQATSRKTPIRELLRRLGRTSKGPPLPSKQATKETEVEPVDREPQTHESLVEQKPSQLETIRISTARLDSILLQAEEMVSAKLAASQRITDLRGIGAALVTWKKEWTKIQAVVRTIQQSLEGNGQHNGSKRNQQTTRLIEFLEWNNTFVKSMEGQLSLLTRTAEQDHRLLAGMVDDLLND